MLVGWLGTTQASCRLGCSNNHVRRLAAAGQLRSVRTPHGILIDPESVNALLQARRQRVGSPSASGVA